jgi:hypothetical protein
MPFPAGLTLVEVTCQFDELPSGGAYGTVRIAYDGPLTGAADNSIVPYVDESAALSAAGTCTIEVPATNDPGWVPVGFAYTVTAKLGPVVRRGTLQLDYQTVEVNLADMVQWDGAATTGTTYATLAQLTALDAEKLDVAGGTVTGDLAVSGAVLRVEGAAGTFRQLQYGSGAAEEDTRWSIHANNTAESGGGAGSDLRIVRYDDDGVALDAPLGIARSTGAVALGGPRSTSADGEPLTTVSSHGPSTRPRSKAARSCPRRACCRSSASEH